MSGKPAKNLNAKRVEWYTPREILEHFRPKDYDGPIFDYDPATTMEIAAYHGIPNFDTINTNGLVADWSDYDRIWINPPFDRKAEFLKKAVDTYDDTGNYILILLPIEFLTTKKFHQIMGDQDYIVHLPNGRIKFLNGNGSVSPAFGSVIIELGSYAKDAYGYTPAIERWEL